MVFHPEMFILACPAAWALLLCALRGGPARSLSKTIIREPTAVDQTLYCNSFFFRDLILREKEKLMFPLPELIGTGTLSPHLPAFF